MDKLKTSVYFSLFLKIFSSTPILVTFTYFFSIVSVNAADISFTPIGNQLDNDPVNDIRVLDGEIVPFDIFLDTSGIAGLNEGSTLELIYEISFDSRELTPNFVNVNQGTFSADVNFQALDVESNIAIVGNQNLSTLNITSPLTVIRTSVPIDFSGTIDTWSFIADQTVNDGISDFSLSLISAIATLGEDESTMNETKVDIRDQFTQLDEPQVELQPLRFGTWRFPYDSFDGTLDSISLDLGSGLVSTGPISYSLDPEAEPGTSFSEINFDSATETLELDLIITFPLLDELGEQPLKIHISEVGPVEGIPEVPEIGTSNSLTLRSVLQGGGTINQPGSIFDGFVFTNSNIHIRGNNNTVTVNTDEEGNTNIGPGSGTEIDTDVEVESSTIKDGNGDIIDETTGEGSGNSTSAMIVSPVPEPLTILGTAVATCFGAFFKRQVKGSCRKEGGKSS